MKRKLFPLKVQLWAILMIPSGLISTKGLAQMQTCPARVEIMKCRMPARLTCCFNGTLLPAGIFIAGSIDLNGRVVTLAPSTLLVNDSEISRITGMGGSIWPLKVFLLKGILG